TACELYCQGGCFGDLAGRRIDGGSAEANRITALEAALRGAVFRVFPTCKQDDVAVHDERGGRVVGPGAIDRDFHHRRRPRVRSGLSRRGRRGRWRHRRSGGLRHCWSRGRRRLGRGRNSWSGSRGWGNWRRRCRAGYQHRGYEPKANGYWAHGKSLLAYVEIRQTPVEERAFTAIP